MSIKFLINSFAGTIIVEKIKTILIRIYKDICI